MQTFSAVGNHKRTPAVSEMWVGNISICPSTIGFFTVACHVIRNRVCVLSSYMFRPELRHLPDLKHKKALWETTVYRVFHNELREYKDLL